jgi:hypothetical protein
MKRPLFLFIVLAAASVVSTDAAHAQISIRSPLSDDREASPGSVYDGEIIVWNETTEFQQAKIYQTDYRFYADGTNVYGDPGNDPRSNARWTEVSASTITIPPGESVPVTYRVEVPDSMDSGVPAGTYWSMIMVEAVPKGSPESTIDPETGEPRYLVMQIMRYGIQVATHIEGTGASALSIANSELKLREDGSAALQVAVENAGDRLIRPDMWVELYDEEGNALGRFDGVQNRIYPQTSVRQEVGLGRLGPGTYRALVIFDGGGDNVFGAEYTLAVN